MAERDNRRGGRREEREENPEFQDRLVAINRVSKTVKGGKRRNRQNAAWFACRCAMAAPCPMTSKAATARAR